MDARGGKPPTIAAVTATYEEETTTIARGLGISFTSEASARLYDRQGIVYVPITDRPRNYTALACIPRACRTRRPNWSSTSVRNGTSARGNRLNGPRPITDALPLLACAPQLINVGYQ